MRVVRALVSGLLVLGLAAMASRARAGAEPSSAPASCSAAQLSAALVGPLRVSSVAGYGCEEGWAYLWANVGTGAAEVSVTELFAFDPLIGGWRVVDRGTYCVASRLPALIYHRGCLSN